MREEVKVAHFEICSFYWPSDGKITDADNWMLPYSTVFTAHGGT